MRSAGFSAAGLLGDAECFTGSPENAYFFSECVDVMTVIKYTDGMTKCLDCLSELTDQNWSPSSQKQRRYVCRPCSVARATEHANANADKRRRYMAEYYQQNRAKLREQSKAWFEAHREQALASSKRSAKKRRDTDPVFRKANIARAVAWQRAHRPVLAIRAKKRRDALRAETLNAYGHACACTGCTETRAEFLAIDHTNGDGAAHRREICGHNKLFGGTRIYGWLKKRGFPTDRFRLLCHNCNLARGLYGYCPHERETAARA